MTNEERQKSIENGLKKEFGKFVCEKRVFCCFCKKEKENPCAKAYNRMNSQCRYRPTTERDRYSWGD